MPAPTRRSFLRFLAASTLAVSWLGQTACAQTAAAPRKPNIVYILADDLGYGDLGCYGQDKILTPNIDKLAAEGLRFTQAYAGCTVCAPSRCSLMTGQTTGHTFIRGNAKVNLRPQDVTVAEVLNSAGYGTAIVGKWGLGEANSPGSPNKKGFDYFYGFIDQTHAHNSYPSFLYRNEDRVPLRNVIPNEGRYGQGVATVKLDFANDQFRDEIVSYMKRSVPGPYFMYAAVTAPHANNEARLCEVPDLGPYVSKDWPDPQKRHAALITRLDTYVGQIMQLIKEQGLDQDTLVIFTSDNGPHQEGSNSASWSHSSGPLRGVKRDLYEGGIRVPMIVRWPGHTPAGSTTDQISTFWDFLPTAAEAAGAPIPKDIDGISLLPTFLGKPQPQTHEFLYWEFHEGGFHQAVRMGDWKAVRHGLAAPLELYDLKTDLAEARDVAKDHPDIVQKITAYLATARTDSKEFPLPRQ